MSLYSRKDYDEEMVAIEHESQRLSGLVADGIITGFDCLRLSAMVELAQREAKKKLLRTAFILSSKDIKRKGDCSIDSHGPFCTCAARERIKVREAKLEEQRKCGKIVPSA
jgi:hypothetical protein